MAVLINATLVAKNKVTRIDGRGENKVIYELDFKGDNGVPIKAIAFFPVGRNFRCMLPGDKVEVGVQTETYKWCSSMGDIDLLTENVIIYVERIK